MVFVYQTDITARNYPTIQSRLRLFLKNTEWNFDFMDDQNILRVVPVYHFSFCSATLVQNIKSLGFSCVELKEDQ